MTGVLAACLWAISANVIAMVPFTQTFRIHWNLARVLVLCLPLVLWLVGTDHGLGWMFGALAVAIFQLRLMLNHMRKQLMEYLRSRK